MKKSIQEGLNKQVNHELNAAYHYLAMAAHFEAESLGGFAKWMLMQSKEEVEHAMRIYEHVNDRGGKVLLDAVAKPDAKFDSVLDVFRKALKLEQNNTKAIHSLYELAVKEGDYPAQTMLHWFIDEQVEEESLMEDVIAQLEMAGDSGSAILMLNARMGDRKDD
jgi:ferritin